jgi:hypothetical protein
MYSVEVKTSAKELKDVKVDASTGKVLHVDAGGDHKDEEDEWVCGRSPENPAYGGSSGGGGHA